MTAYEMLNNKDEVLTLPIIKKHYKNRVFDAEKFCDSAADCFVGKDKPYNIECWPSHETNSVELEFTYMRSWNGELTNYSCTLKCDPTWKIRTVSALHCSEYYSSDARGDGLKNRRAEDFDFFILDKLLDYACE